MSTEVDQDATTSEIDMANPVLKDEAIPGRVDVVIDIGGTRKVVHVSAPDLFTDPVRFASDIATLRTAAAVAAHAKDGSFAETKRRQPEIVSWKRSKDGGTRYEVAVFRNDDPKLVPVDFEFSARDAMEACAMAAWSISRSSDDDPASIMDAVVTGHAFFPKHAPLSWDQIVDVARRIAPAIPAVADLVAVVDAPFADDTESGAVIRDGNAQSGYRVRFHTKRHPYATMNLSIVVPGPAQGESLTLWMADASAKVADRFFAEDMPDRMVRAADLAKSFGIVSIKGIGRRRYHRSRIICRTMDGLVRSFVRTHPAVDAEDLVTQLSYDLSAKSDETGKEAFEMGETFLASCIIDIERVTTIPVDILSERLVEYCSAALEQRKLPTATRTMCRRLVSVLSRPEVPLPEDRVPLAESAASLLLPVDVDPDGTMMSMQEAAALIANTRSPGKPSFEGMGRPGRKHKKADKRHR
jgi:hypothetical protein